MNKAEKSIHAKKTILSTACNLLSSQEEFSVRNIAKKAKISSGLIYYHFKDLNGLIDEVIHEHYLRIYQAIDLHHKDDTYLVKFMVAEILSTLSAKKDTSTAMFFAYIPDRFIPQHVSDMIMFLEDYNITIANEDAKFYANILFGALTSSRIAILNGNLAESVYDVMLRVLKLIFLPLGIGQNELDRTVAVAKEVAGKIRRIDILPENLDEKYLNQEENTKFLSD